MPDKGKMFLPLQPGKPGRHTPDEIVVYRQIDGFGRVRISVPMKYSLDKVMTEEPGPARDQEFLSGQARKFFPEIAADVFQIPVNDVLSVSQHVPPYKTIFLQ
jgi:hypothetical protein